MTETAKPSYPPSSTRLNSKLDQKLAAYMAAAGAAGVGLLGFSPSAEAKVVYTPANTVLAFDGSTPIDLNNDGIADFMLRMFNISHSIFLVIAPDVAGNAIRCCAPAGGANAGFFGVPVGPGEKFATSTFYGGLLMADAGVYTHTWFFGPWANATNRYLGFKFLINGQTHFGWARLTVANYALGGNVVLTGYAYETIPNVNIIEGYTSGPEKASNFARADLLAPPSQPASLGMLARGADALSIWRREDELATN
jgi:hypothetical protein